MGIFSTLKGINKKTNSAYNFLKGFNSLLTGDSKTNELEQKVTDSESWILSSGRFMEQNEIMERFHMGNEYGTGMDKCGRAQSRHNARSRDWLHCQGVAA